MRGILVTGTDTGVGKTILSACLLAAMRQAGERVRAHKPVVTGLDEMPGAWPADHELLGQIAGMDPLEVAPLRYGPAVSPHLAAALAGERIDSARMLALARAAGDPTDGMGTGEEQAGSAAGQDEKADDGREPILIVEGVGGLLVPLSGDWTVRDMARELGLPLLIAARPGLGTINHTLLTLEAARGAGLEVRAVVLTPWPEGGSLSEDGSSAASAGAGPSPMQLSNRETIARLGEVEVQVLRLVQRPDREQLAAAGAALPWRRWLEPISGA